MLIPNMNDEHALKSASQYIEFGPGKYGQYFAAPIVDPTMACLHFAPVTKENKRCTSQHARITIVGLVHVRDLLTKFSYIMTSRLNVYIFPFLSWKKTGLITNGWKERESCTRE